MHTVYRIRIMQDFIASSNFKDVIVKFSDGYSLDVSKDLSSFCKYYQLFNF